MTATGNPQTAFGEVLQQQRQAAGLSQQELAERAGLSRRGISDLERGRRRSPYPATVRQLADGLGLDSTGRAALLASARPRPVEGVVGGLHGSPSSALPLPSTTLIGREYELDEVRRLLASTRLLTLTGAGGSGKTRLALEAARASSGAFLDGTALVLLAPVANPDMVAPAIAQALGVHEIAGVPLHETLIAYLRPRTLLLVLDNFEHLLAAAGLVGDLLAVCRNITVLATSREALRLREEQEFSVPPLELPPSERAAPAVSLLRCASVELFAQRSAQILPSFRLTSDTARIAADICLRLDGLPLAIELAAARIKVMSPAALLERLEHRLPLLIGGARDLPARQRTLRAAIAWSHDLLASGDWCLFRRLSVFAGGCTLEAAEAFTREDTDLGRPALDALASLVDKHLIERQDGPQGEPRFVMLETIREFALEQLEASGEVERMRERHAALFAQFAEQVEPHLGGGRRRPWLARVEADRDNFRAALGWSFERRRPDPGLRILGSLWVWWYMAAISEGRSWADAILGVSSAEPSSHWRSKALFTAGLLAWGAGDLAEEARLLAEGLALARTLKSDERLAWAMVLFPLNQPDSRERLHSHYAECLEAAAASDNAWLVADAHLCYGASAAQLSDPVTACQQGRAAVDQFHALGDDWFEGLGEVQLGLGLLQLGDSAQATAHLRVALRMVQDWKWRAVSHLGLGLIARQQENVELMGSTYADGLECCRDAGDVGNAALALEGLAATAATRGATPDAARLLGAADAAHTSGVQPTLPGVYEQLYPRTEAIVRPALGDARFLDAWREGQKLTLDQALVMARALIASHH